VRVEGWGGDSSKAPVTVRPTRAGCRATAKAEPMACQLTGIELINGEQVEQVEQG
jgi:hypothetical protein